MPKKDKTGPPKTSKGPKDGRGKGKGNLTRSPGVGSKKGSKKGFCK